MDEAGTGREDGAELGMGAGLAVGGGKMAVGGGVASSSLPDAPEPVDDLGALPVDAAAAGVEAFDVMSGATFRGPVITVVEGDCGTSGFATASSGALLAVSVLRLEAGVGCEGGSDDFVLDCFTSGSAAGRCCSSGLFVSAPADVDSGGEAGLAIVVPFPPLTDPLLHASNCLSSSARLEGSSESGNGALSPPCSQSAADCSGTIGQSRSHSYSSLP